MTKDEIGKMYQKANGWNPIIFEITMQELERFTALVMAHEREACAKVCDGFWLNGRYLTDVADSIRARGNE